MQVEAVRRYMVGDVLRPRLGNARYRLVAFDPMDGKAILRSMRSGDKLLAVWLSDLDDKWELA